MATVTPTLVKLYYDVISPYSWIAFEVLTRYRNKWNITLDYNPFFLGGVMNGSGNTPPGMNPYKAKYMLVDLQRLSKYYQVPLVMPADPAEAMFTKGSLSAVRLLTAAKDLCPNKLEELSRQFWLRVWSKDEDITTNESLAQVCEKCNISHSLTDQLLASISTQSVKQKLKEVTQEALDLGAFGAPFIVAEVQGKPQVFAGNDRYEVIADIISEKWEGPLNHLKAKY